MRRPNLHAGLHQALGRWYLCFALSSGSARRASFWPPHSDFANHHQRPRLSSAFGPPKTRASVRSVALDERTLTALREQRKQQATEQLAAGRPGTTPGRGWSSATHGSPVSPNALSHHWRHVAAASGLPKLRLHDLRHTHATLALAAGVHPKVVQERLGHSTVAFTLDVYSHAVPALQEEAAERVAALFAE